MAIWNVYIEATIHFRNIHYPRFWKLYRCTRMHYKFLCMPIVCWYPSNIAGCDCRVLNLSGRLSCSCCIWKLNCAWIYGMRVFVVYVSFVFSLIPWLFSPLLTELNIRLDWILERLESMFIASQPVGLMLQSFIFRFRMYLYRRFGLPGGLEPIVSFP